MNDEFFSFDEALDELRLKEEELKRLVSEGEIRAFRDGDTMKLRRSDVESLRVELSGGDVVDLGTVAEDLVFEDDPLADETGMATQEITDVDTIIEDDVEDVGDLDLDLEDEVEEVETRPARRTASAGAAAGAYGAATVEETEGVGMRVALIATTLVLMLAGPVVLAATNGKVSSLAASIAGIFGEVSAD